MTIPRKSLKSGFSLPVYGIGTWGMGGERETDYSRDRDDIEALKAAIEHGVTHIDTAELYGAGHAEELVAEVIKDSDRSKLFISSKLHPQFGSADEIEDRLDQSLARLSTGYLDLYMLHRYPGEGISITDTMRELDKLVDNGKIRSIGVCNFTVPMLEEAKKYTRNPIVCNQVHYSLKCREIVDKGILDYCQANDIMIVAWGPLEKGMLAPDGLLSDIADKYQKTPYQAALNWLINQRNVVVIPKTSSAPHLTENLGAIGWVMDGMDYEKLRTSYPDQTLVSDRVPLDYQVDL